MIGETLGSYQLVRELGKGAMGAVYLAEHTLLQRQAAIKVLLPALSKDQTMLQRFFNEARAITAIHHPGIVQVFDFGRHADGSAYLIMEYLEGEDLADRLERLERLPVSEALRIARHCAGALAAAHEAGIIHRDLKPENIYLVPDSEIEGGERAKIVDFGIAKLSDERRSGLAQTQSGSVLGTPLYMAPEQSRSASAVDHRADIYSLGCVLFHMLGGQPPFVGSGIGDTIASHLFEPPPPIHTLAPDVPPEVDEVIQRALAKDPADRYATMTEMAQAIDALGAHASAPGISRSSLAVASPAVSRRAGSSALGKKRASGSSALQETLPAHEAGTTLGSAAAQSMASASGRPRGGLAVLGLTVAAIALSVAGIMALSDPAPAPAEDSAPAPPEEPTPAAATKVPESAPAPEARAPQPIQVQVESDPPGASVYASGQAEPLGTTPYTYEALPATGETTLRLALEGYDAEEISFPADQSGMARVSMRKSSRGPGARGTAPRRGKRRKPSSAKPSSPAKDALLYR